jgi:hypothetical protein
MKTLWIFAVGGLIAQSASLRILAHEVGISHPTNRAPTTIISLPTVVETRGPIKVPRRSDRAILAPVSGQGFWSFEAWTNAVLPIPDLARTHLKGAHGTLVVDAERDLVYWGLEQVGWVKFSDQLKQSSIVQGDPAFSRGNLHGADLWPQHGKLPLIAVADNVEGEVYLSDTSFTKAEILGRPQVQPYAHNEGFHPTDVAFTEAGKIYVTDGYGQAYFMPASTDPLRYQGSCLGGKQNSQTPHGITFDKKSGSLILSARPEGQLQWWPIRKHEAAQVLALPAGSTVCDVDLWGCYALAPCLDGPGNSPGPIYIVNLRKKAIVSIIRPREDLGFMDAAHIHDAAWYFVKQGRRHQIFIIFTSWNPGGIGVLRLVG